MRCRVCDGFCSPFSEYDFKLDAFKKVYTDKLVYKCNECDLRQANIDAVNSDSLMKYYAFAYRGVARIATADSEFKSTYYEPRGKALAELIDIPDPKTAFEIGCGYGYNLYEIKHRFPSIELFADELDREIFPDNAVCPAKLSDRNRDIIILSHVLEHFEDPVGLMQLVRKQVSSNGVIVIDLTQQKWTPDYAAI